MTRPTATLPATLGARFLPLAGGLALALALGGCRLLAPAGSVAPLGPAEAGPTTGSPAADEEPVACGGTEPLEVVLLDIWGRDLDVVAQGGPTEPASTYAGECAPIRWLACGETASGDTSDWNEGITDAIDGWPVAVGNYQGSEAAYAFQAPSHGRVVWSLVDPEPSAINHDLFVLDGTGGRCEAAAAIERGFNEVEFDAVAGRTYFLVLDSSEQDAGAYEVSLDCGGADADVVETLPSTAGPVAPQDGPFEWTFTAEDHLPTTVSGRVIDGRFEDVGVTGTARWALSSDLRPSDEGELCRVETLYVGLDHAWYAASADRPPRVGNRVELMHSGEDAWAGVHSDLLEASEQIHIATWMWESDHELLRPDDHATLTDEQRQAHTLLAVLDSMPDVDKRVLVSRFCDDDCGGLLDWVTVDDALALRGQTPDDRFEVAAQGNPTDVPLFDEFEPAPVHWSFVERVAARPDFADRDFAPDPFAPGSDERFDAPIASYHQKLMAIDGEVAWVGGMNLKGNDWDTTEHEVFDPRRMDLDATFADRLAVAQREARPDHSPRKDYAARLEGPLVHDVDSLLLQRWQQSISAEEPFTAGNTTWTPSAPAAALSGGVEAQFQLTMPTPASERSILESLLKAFAQAEEFIYIEDQYWRAPALNEVLLERLKARPELKLVVVTSEVLAIDPAAEWTIRTDELFRSEVPDQYLTLTTRSFDWAPAYDLFDGWVVEPHVVPHSLHSKLVIVDDRYLSIGSANKNNRGMLYEGEANIAVLDDGWVRDRRIEIFDNLLGPGFAPQMTDDFSETWELLQEAANWNEWVAAWWEDAAPGMSESEAASAAEEVWPSGFLAPLVFPEDSVVAPGPDAV